MNTPIDTDWSGNLPLEQSKNSPIDLGFLLHW